MRPSSAALTTSSQFKEGLDRSDCLVRRAQVRAVARRVQDDQFAVDQVVVNVLPNSHGSDRIFLALQNKRAHRCLGKVGTVIGQERYGGELLGDLGIGSAKAVAQFF